MSTTPTNKSKLTLRNKKKEINEYETETLTSTPNRQTQRLLVDKDYSPVFLPCTQETLDKVDVLWDWNSPQSKSSYTRTSKRSTKATSPKLPLKKHPPVNQVKSFDKLKEELRAFQDEIKQTTETHGYLFDDGELVYNNNGDKLEDLFFDDSIDEKLLLASQQIEKILESEPKTKARNLLSKSFSSNALESTVVVDNIQRKTDVSSINDSFDVALEFFKEEDSFARIKEDARNDNLKLKTKSLSFGDHYAETRANMQKEHDAKMRQEIERKRLEARAKLEKKKRLPPPTPPTELSDSDTSPIKYSPTEIEIKRQQALAKLEAKKQQEIIERKRQEALKRLEMNRKKRALQQNTSG